MASKTIRATATTTTILWMSQKVPDAKTYTRGTTKMKATKEDVLKKALKVINSCVSPKQVFQASRFARLACDMFPGIYGPVREALTQVEITFDK